MTHDNKVMYRKARKFLINLDFRLINQNDNKVMDLLALSNSAANFLLYFIMSSQVITDHKKRPSDQEDGCDFEYKIDWCDHNGIFSVPKHNQKNAQSSSKSSIRQKDCRGGKETRGRQTLVTVSFVRRHKAHFGLVLPFNLIMVKTFLTQLCSFQKFPTLKRDIVVNESPEHLKMKKLYTPDVGIMV